MNLPAIHHPRMTRVAFVVLTKHAVAWLITGSTGF